MFLLSHQIILPFHHWMKAAPLGLRVASDFLLHFCRVSLRGWGVRSSFGNPVATAIEMQGHYVPERDRVVPPLKFAAVARVLWPFKTAAHLAVIAGKDERTAKRWLSGEYEPPGSVIAAVILEITKRD